jgi:hypothetical protein
LDGRRFASPIITAAISAARAVVFAVAEARCSLQCHCLTTFDLGLAVADDSTADVYVPFNQPPRGGFFPAKSMTFKPLGVLDHDLAPIRDLDMNDITFLKV